MRKNSVLSFLFTAVLILMLCASCGGGGGATLYNSENSPPRNEGVNHNWGAGSSGTTTGFTVGSGSSETLFSAFPSFFSPIDHIDISLSINGGAPITLTGLNASSTRDALPALSIGDVVTGTATITLQDGSTRPAVLSAMTVGSGTELRFAVQYKYKLHHSDSPAPLIEPEGTYYSASGIDTSVESANLWISSTGSNISYWEAANGARYTGTVLSGFSGDIELTAKFAFGCTTPNNATIYRYCMDSTDTPVTASFSLSGGTGPYTVSCSSNVLSGTASGSTVNISIDSSFTGRLSNSFSAAGEPVTVTVTDAATNETATCTINVVDCVGDTTGIELNPALSSVSGLTLALPSDGKINGSAASTKIARTAFDSNTAITSLSLPSTVFMIEGNQGGGNPGSVTTTGAFANSSIQTISATGLTNVGQAAFGQSQISSIDLSRVTSIGRYAFYGCQNLGNINLTSLTTLGDRAFADCSNLSTVTWWNSPSGPTRIPEYAFYNTGLTSVTIPASVQEINDYAFQNCTSLTSVDVSSATSVGADAFNGCSALDSITVKGDASIGRYAFKGCSDGLTLVLTGPDAKIAGGGTLGNWSYQTINQCTNVTFDLSDCTNVTFNGGALGSAADGSCTVSKVKLSKNIISLNIGNLDILSQPSITFTITVDDNSNIIDFFSNFKTTVIHDDSNDNRNKAKCKFEINAGSTRYAFSWNTTTSDWDVSAVL